MKRILITMLIGTMLLSLTACGGRETTDGASPSSEVTGSEEVTREPESEAIDTEEPVSEAEEETTEETGATESHALVVYFSWSGNTEQVAEAIRARTDADVFEIIPAEAYTDDYNTLLDIAKQEKQEGARPAIAGSIDNIDQYDVIYVGYPNWWSDMPMILYTFFDDYDLSGKTIAPFCTSGGGGLVNTVNSIREAEPDAEVAEGLHINGSAASDPDQAVGEWLDHLNLAE